MKKVFLTLFALTAMTLVSCGTKNEEAKEANEAESATQEQAAQTAEAVSSNESESTTTTTPTTPSYIASLQPEDVILPSQLKGKVEVLNGENDCIPVEFSDNGYPEVTITFKLLEKVETAPLASSYGQLWIVGVGQDSAGRDVKDLLPNYGEWRTGDSDGSEFKSFLEGEPDETITLSFTGENNVELFEKDEAKIQAGREKTEAAMAKVAKFKLKITNE